MATVGQICTREVVVTTSDATVTRAAQLMRDHHVGTLVVTEPGGGDARPVGIVTDRDLVVEIMALDLDPSDVTVGEIMTPELVTARENEDSKDVLERMRYKGVRRIPVLSAHGRLLGILASDDLLSTLADELATLADVAARERFREAAQRKPLSV